MLQPCISPLGKQFAKHLMNKVYIGIDGLSYTRREKLRAHLLKRQCLLINHGLQRKVDQRYALLNPQGLKINIATQRSHSHLKLLTYDLR
ncbi:hypothetical protein CYD26_12920 [Pseudomonas sp. FFUP_PS_473]|nr:hypothetical protein CYD26_12920 [Pseudomonas sp. FFUP_PS_473]